MSFGFGVGDIVAVLTLANQLRRDFVGAPAQFKGISDDVRNLSIILQDADIQLPDHTLEDSQRKRLAQITHTCEKILQELEREIGKHRVVTYTGTAIHKRVTCAWKRVSWNKEDLSELRDRLAFQMSLLQAYLDGISRQTTAAIRQSLGQISRRQKNEEESEILQWLTSADYISQQGDLIERRQQGTGQWLLDLTEYSHWIETAQASIFAHGMPGAGKTICSAIIIDDLFRQFEHREDIGIAYLYCNFKQRDEQNIRDLLASLLKQLCQKMSALPESVKEFYNHHKGSSIRPRPDKFSQVLCSVASMYSRVFIVIDALDECDSKDDCRARLLEEMLKLRIEARVNLFATSRPTEVPRCFEEGPSLEIRATEEDVRKYLKGNLSRLPKFVGQNVQLQNDIENVISARVQGMFLLAQLHLDSLKGRRSAKSIRNALERLSEKSDHHAYDDAYDEAMQRINAQLPEQQELAIQSLSWITFAKRPLTVLELLHALAIEKGTSELDPDNIPLIEDVVSVCAGLLNTEGEVVRLVHYTTQEYFERTHALWFSTFSEAEISDLCVTYLLFDDFYTVSRESKSELESRFLVHPLYGYAALNWKRHAQASQSVSAEMVQFLEHDAKIECSMRMATYSYRGEKSLHLAAHYGLECVIPLLLERNHDVEMRDVDGSTPLIHASLGGHSSTAKLLLEKGANVNAFDQNGRTALYWLSHHGHTEMVRLLLDLGAPVDPKDPDCDTALMAASAQGQLEVVNLLLSQGADINRTDDIFGSSLDRALNYGHFNILQVLLDGGAVITEESIESASRGLSAGLLKTFFDKVKERSNDMVVDCGRALYFAALRGDLSLVQVLTNNGADLNMNYLSFGETPLAVASHQGDIEIVRHFLHLGADVNGPSSTWGSALLAAARRGHQEIVRILLEHKPNPAVRGRERKTAFELARHLGYHEIAEMVEKYVLQLKP